jgi:UDP-N-acetyl-D-galactosamine dehydrogenase
MIYQIAVIGLGYVGLPLALAFANKFPHTIGFDINQKKIKNLQSGIDRTGEVESDLLQSSTLKITANIQDLSLCNFFIVTVPTPIDNNKRPDLKPLISASEMLGKIIKRGSIIIYESTVYPGVTQQICGSILAEVSGLKQGVDFKLAYSPERVNPGDKSHSLTKITKVVAAEDQNTLDIVASLYKSIISAGIYCAPSIEVAEMAKVIENTQRDINIALMNEIALICDLLELRTQDVLNTARTKWNFLPFSPGLVGGHCIGVDPYYLTAKAKELGYYPEVILSGRRINDYMGSYIAQKLVKLLVKRKFSLQDPKVGILGLTFKENISDLRNSRIPDIVTELNEFGIHPLIHDPFADVEEAKTEYGLKLSPWEKFNNLDGLIIAVAHQQYLSISSQTLSQLLKVDGVIMDIKSILNPKAIPSNFTYWSL